MSAFLALAAQRHRAIILAGVMVLASVASGSMVLLHLMTVSAASGPALMEIEDALADLPNNAAWQGVANDGTYFYLLTSQNTSTDIANGKENIIRKYRISDGQLMATKSDAYTNTKRFSSGEVIDGKLHVTVRGASLLSTWAHVAIYDTDDLSLLEDHDIETLDGYVIPEGVAKKDGYFWVIFSGFGGAFGNGKISAVVKYDIAWNEVASYQLATIPTGNSIGGQDIVWISEDEIITNMHEDKFPGEDKLDRWKWQGDSFVRVARYQQLPDDAGHTLGQGFTWLDGYLYLAARYSDRLVKVELTTEKIDTDGDGCSDQSENGPDETIGGLRDPLNGWDFYDVLGPGAALPIDGVIDLPNDILGVIQHHSPTGAPPYDVQFDRGPSSGPNPWNMTAPDGVIDLPNDILGVILQFGHDCR